MNNKVVFFCFLILCNNFRAIYCGNDQYISHNKGKNNKLNYLNYVPKKKKSFVFRVFNYMGCAPYYKKTTMFFHKYWLVSLLGYTSLKIARYKKIGYAKSYSQKTRNSSICPIISFSNITDADILENKINDLHQNIYGSKLRDGSSESLYFYNNMKLGFLDNDASEEARKNMQKVYYSFMLPYYRNVVNMLFDDSSDIKINLSNIDDSFQDITIVHPDYLLECINSSTVFTNEKLKKNFSIIQYFVHVGLYFNKSGAGEVRFFCDYLKDAIKTINNNKESFVYDKNYSNSYYEHYNSFSDRFLCRPAKWVLFFLDLKELVV